jgi:hypothetical protein
MLTCEECGCRSREGKGWLAFLAPEPDGPTEVAIFCPPCAAREYGLPEAPCDYI